MIYAGIDEAGYGPLFGPLVVGRAVFGLKHFSSSDAPPGQALWKHLEDVIATTIGKRKGRIVVNDSKKLHSKSSGTKHLEFGVLLFSELAGVAVDRVDRWLDGMGEKSHRQLDALPWYQAADDRPWRALPRNWTDGEMAIARSMLKRAADREGFEVLDLGASLVFEDRFNQMVKATRSKASTNFTFVMGHLRSIWDRYGEQHPVVITDRQSARMRYRELLAMSFDNANIQIMEETDSCSAYRIESKSRSMTVQFEVEADGNHMPVALASMISKFSRELMMARFQAWFTERAPDVKPTAGYGSDGKRFWTEIEPLLPELSIDGSQLKRAR